MPDQPDLTALLGSRICHDLISPIGAIGNGVELLFMDGGSARPELTLISDSVLHANARVRYFRLAFGAPGHVDHEIARSECQSILSDLTRGSRLKIEWTSPSSIPRREAKLTFLMLMCFESALPHGGTVTVERSETRWHLTATGNRLKIEPDLWDMLSNPATRPDLAPATVHFGLLSAELTRQHRRMTVEIRDPEIRLSF